MKVAMKAGMMANKKAAKLDFDLAESSGLLLVVSRGRKWVVELGLHLAGHSAVKMVEQKADLKDEQRVDSTEP